MLLAEIMFTVLCVLLALLCLIALSYLMSLFEDLYQCPQCGESRALCPCEHLAELKEILHGQLSEQSCLSKFINKSTTVKESGLVYYPGEPITLADLVAYVRRRNSVITSRRLSAKIAKENL